MYSESMVMPLSRLQGAASGGRDLLSAARAVRRGLGEGCASDRGRAALCVSWLHSGSVPGRSGRVRGAERVAGQPGALAHHVCVTHTV